MATFAEIMQGLGGKLDTGINSPFTQLGLQLMQAGGYQPGPITGGQRLAQAGQGFMQQRQQAQEQQQAQMMRQLQMQQVAAQQQASQREEAKRQRIMEEALRNPNLVPGSPLANAILQQTGDISGIADIAKIGQPAGQPKMPWQYEQNLPTGEQVQFTYNPATGRHEPSQPFRPTAQQAVDVRSAQVGLGQQRWETEQQFRERQAAEKAGQFQQGMEFKQQQAGTQQKQWETEQERMNRQAETAAQKAQTAAEKEQRAAAATQLKTKIDRTNLQGGYRGAVAQIDDSIKLIDKLVKHPGLARNYGKLGVVPNVPGSDAADAAALMEQFKAKVGLTELSRLAAAGVTLTPVSNADIVMVKQAGANIDKEQSVEQARQQMLTFKQILQRAKEEAATTYGQLDSLYDVREDPRQPAGAPAVGAVEDGYEYVGGDPANPSSWRKR